MHNFNGPFPTSSAQFLVMEKDFITKNVKLRTRCKEEVKACINIKIKCLQNLKTITR